jgi:hypothetical protein
MADSHIEDINSHVTTLWPGDHPWDSFIHHLRTGPVHFPRHRRATLVDEFVPGYGHPGESWFVFEIHQYGGNKFYKRTTTENSFGSNYDGETNEVTPVEVQRTDWETVQ